ncbi:MAG: glutathione S-transferase family protein, partial [Gammaproteobacteria bacterium]|nr:glutathione S-transferase family protein [Gammaproteobacteria bacterium]
VMGVTDLGGTLLKWDIGSEIEGLRDWQATMAELDISKKIDADRQANEKEFFAMVQQRIAAR